MIEIRYCDQRSLRLDFITLFHVDRADRSVKPGFDRIARGQAHQPGPVRHLLAGGHIDLPDLRVRGGRVGLAVDQLHAAAEGQGIGDAPGGRGIRIIGDLVIRAQLAVDRPSDHAQDRQDDDRPDDSLQDPAFAALLLFLFRLPFHCFRGLGVPGCSDLHGLTHLRVIPFPSRTFDVHSIAGQPKTKLKRVHIAVNSSFKETGHSEGHIHDP